MNIGLNFPPNRSIPTILSNFSVPPSSLTPTHLLSPLSLSFSTTAAAERVKRQSDTTEDESEAFKRELCKDKGAGEWFRLSLGDCRDVIQCTDAVSVLVFVCVFLVFFGVFFFLVCVFFWGDSIFCCLFFFLGGVVFSLACVCFFGGILLYVFLSCVFMCVFLSCACFFFCLDSVVYFLVCILVVIS